MGEEGADVLQVFIMERDKDHLVEVIAALNDLNKGGGLLGSEDGFQLQHADLLVLLADTDVVLQAGEAKIVPILASVGIVEDNLTE